MTVSRGDDSRFAAASSGSASGYCQLLSYKVTYVFIPVSKGDDKVHSEQEALHRIDMCLSYSMGKTDVDDKVVTRFIPILYVFGH